MTYEFCNQAHQYRGAIRVDPRVPIARHMNWVATTNRDMPSPWHVPEPNNYNYAVRGARPIDCEFIRDQVFYRQEDLRWWSVYYVPQTQITEFETWAKIQPIDFLWMNSKSAPLRHYQKTLYNTKCGELNYSERLFQMGYYAKLQSKYFSEDDTMLLEQMGPIRDRVLLGLEEV